MFKNVLFIKTTSFASFISLGISLIPLSANAYNLSPLSFSKMYNLAQNGEVEALRASVRRGMNIDSLNQNGDTGLCVAAQNRDAYTYNAFRAAGANPRHPCVQRIRYYENFVNSSKAVSVTATPREAYGTMGKEEFKISPTTWWLLGGLAIGGGIVALAAGGGGGGGSNSDSGESERYDTIGSSLGSAASVIKSTSGTAINYSNFTVNNADEKKIASLNFNKNPLESGKYLNIVLEALNGGSYTNAENTNLQITSGVNAMAAVNNATVVNNGYIKAESFNASVGMIATNNSQAINNGRGSINGIDLYFSGFNENNTLLGIYADSNSTITNNGEIRGTAKQASKNPNQEDDSDGSSNDSSSSDTSSTTSVSGTIVGMETMIMNTGTKAVNETVSAKNNGTIKLSAGDNTNTSDEVKVNLIGMGSYLDDGFLNNSKNIQRADKAYLENNGKIALGYTGQYTFDSTKTLRKGLGGIIGMRSDANTTALNNGTIDIVLTDSSSSSSSDSSSSSVAVAAGMQSVHSGTITNNETGKIYVTTTADNSRITYGMIAVEGSGTVSGLYTNIKQTINNNGLIQIKASNGYGMASYNGGTVVNTGNIILGSDSNDSRYHDNIGIYGSNDSTLANLINQGTIDIYSYNSTAMRNDFSGGTTLTNDGIINVYQNASGTNIFSGNYSRAVNNGTIHYYALSSDSSSGSSGSGSSSSGDSTTSTDTGSLADAYSLNVKQKIMTTKSPTASSATTSTTEKVENYGIIKALSSNTAAMAAETKQGQAYNKGTINIETDSVVNNKQYNVGMYMGADTLSSAQLANDGNINIRSNYSVGMASESNSISSVLNQENGVINVYGNKSFGMYSTGNSYLYNNGIINLYGDNNVAIYSKGTGTGADTPYIKNNKVKIYGKYAIVFQIAGNAIVETPGSVEACNASEAGCNAEALSTMTYYYISSGGNLTLSATQSLTAGTLVKLANSGKVNVSESANLSLLLGAENGKIIDASSGGTVTNNGTLNLFSTKNSTAISAGSGATVENYGNINITQTDTASGTGNIGILSSGAKVKNNGNITISTQHSYGMSISDGTTTNNSNITVTTSSSAGVLVTGGEFKNASSGVITVGNGNSFINGGCGIDVSGGTATNNGAIYVYGTNSSGVRVRGGTFENTGTIYVDQGKMISRSYGIYVTGGTAKNSGTIQVFNGAINYIPGTVEDEKNTSSQSLMMVKNNSKFKNNGTISTDTAWNFNESTDSNSYISIGKNGTFKAPHLSGKVMADADITQKGFAQEYRNDNSFIGQDDGLNIVSGSYMFNAKKEQNSSGNTDVVMTMKSFDDIVANKNLSDYLTQNYADKKGETTFNLLKGLSSAHTFNTAINKEFGFSMLPNLAKQDLDVIKNIHQVVNDNALITTNEANRSVVNILTYQQKIGNKQNVSGYKDNVKAVYGFNDYKIAQNWRVGYGATAARSDSDFNDDSNRYNNMLEIFAPIIYSHNNFRVLAEPKAGFSKGHYRRNGAEKIYKADSTNYFYGIDLETKYTIDTNIAQLEPIAGFNINNLKMDKLEESNNGLKIDNDNVSSVQSVIGLDIKNKVDISKDKSLTVVAGGRYFHEFGNKYSTTATMQDMNGFYEIKSNRFQRNSGLLMMKAQYDYKKLSVSATVNAPIEHKNSIYYLFNLGYKF